MGHVPPLLSFPTRLGAARQDACLGSASVSPTAKRPGEVR
jgi:hypothetical protein